MTDYPEPTYIDNTPRAKKRYFTEANHGEKHRSTSFGSIAAAMAQQWGCLTPRAIDRFQRESAEVIPMQSGFIADDPSATSSGN